MCRTPLPPLAFLPRPSWKDLHFGHRAASPQELPGPRGRLPFAARSPQELNKERYEILIYSAGVSSFQLHVLLSRPGCGCRSVARCGPSPEPSLDCQEAPGRAGAGGATEGRTDRQTEAATFFFFFGLFYFIFYLQIFAEKEKQKILFYNVYKSIYNVITEND